MFKLLLILGSLSLSWSYIQIEGPKWPIPLSSNATFIFKSSGEICSTCLITLEFKNGDSSIFAMKSELSILLQRSEELDNDLFTVRSKLKNRNEIFIEINFFKLTNKLNFNVLYRNKSTGKEEEVYHCIIDMYQELELDMRVFTGNNTTISSNSTIGLVPGTLVTATCTTRHGPPESLVDIKGLNTSRVISKKTFDDKRTMEINFTVSLSDHMTKIFCRASNTSITYLITINHPTKSLNLVPEYEPYVRPGSTIKCVAKNGYPLPTIRWQPLDFVNSTGSAFFVSSGDLYIDDKAVSGTILNLRCIAQHISPVTNETMSISKDFIFKVFEPMQRIYINLVILSVLSLIIFVFLLCFIFICYSRKKTAMTIPSCGSMESVIYDTPSNFKRPQRAIEYTSVPASSIVMKPAYRDTNRQNALIYDRPDNSI